VSRATFRNRTAWALWIFTAIWMTCLVAMTWVVVRDGPPDGHSVATVAAIGTLFWAAGIGLSTWTCTFRVLRVDVQDSGALDVVWRSPVRVERRRVEARDVPPAAIVGGKDSDGDPYYHCRVTLADGATLDLAEGHARPPIEETAARFNAATRRAHA
jgi:hypothetical protein